MYIQIYPHIHIYKKTNTKHTYFLVQKPFSSPFPPFPRDHSRAPPDCVWTVALYAASKVYPYAGPKRTAGPYHPVLARACHWLRGWVGDSQPLPFVSIPPLLTHPSQSQPSPPLPPPSQPPPVPSVYRFLMDVWGDDLRVGLADDALFVDMGDGAPPAVRATVHWRMSRAALLVRQRRAGRPTPELESLLRGVAAEVPDHFLATYWLGDYLVDVAGYTPEAALHLRAALALRPDDAEVTTLVAQCYRWVEGEADLGRCAELFRRALELAQKQRRPAPFGALVGLAETVYELVQTPSMRATSLDLLRRAVDMEPHVAGVQLSLASMLLRGRQFGAGAARALRRADDLEAAELCRAVLGGSGLGLKVGAEERAIAEDMLRRLSGGPGGDGERVQGGSASRTTGRARGVSGVVRTKGCRVAGCPRTGKGVCGGCRSDEGRYCSAECQQAHWPAHRARCLVLREAREEKRGTDSE